MIVSCTVATAFDMKDKDENHIFGPVIKRVLSKALVIPKYRCMN